MITTVTDVNNTNSKNRRSAPPTPPAIAPMFLAKPAGNSEGEAVVVFITSSTDENITRDKEVQTLLLMHPYDNVVKTHHTSEVQFLL